MFTAAAGDRPDVPDVAIVVWDGIPTSDWQQAIDYAIQARQRGIRIIGFGVGTDVQQFGLATISSWPSSETVFVVPSSSQLPSLRDQLINATCNSESLNMTVIYLFLIYFDLFILAQSKHKIHGTQNTQLYRNKHGEVLEKK